MLLYINNVHENADAFESKVKNIATSLQVDPNWLMQVMYSESGLNPKAVNKYSDATGLIQFMPATAKGLGTTVQALYNMSNLQQLDYVYKYFQTWKGRMKSYYDVYAATFFPAMIGKPDDWVLQTSSLPASLIARQNPAVNINKDDKITVGEFKQYVKRTVSQSYWSTIFNLCPNCGQVIHLAIPLIVLLTGIFF